jgi:hypothetical protein
VNTQAFTQSLRPFSSVAAFSAISMAGHSSYHGVQFTARRQYGTNLAFIANYTRSKSLDDGSGLFSFSQPETFDEGQFPRDFRKFDRAMSAFDRPNVFTAALQYRTRGSAWLRDIEFDPIITARDGLPTSITQNNLNPAAHGLRPNLINNTSIYTSSVCEWNGHSVPAPDERGKFPARTRRAIVYGNGREPHSAAAAGVSDLLPEIPFGRPANSIWTLPSVANFQSGNAFDSGFGPRRSTSSTTRTSGNPAPR